MYLNWIAKKNIDYKLVNSLLEKCIESNQFTNGGPNTKLLEDYIKNKMKIDDTKSVIVVTNGAVALHCLTSAISYNEKKNIKWATQSFTFPPSAQSNLSNIDIIDIDLYGGIDLTKIHDSINGLIITNIFGNIVDVKKYTEWAKKRNGYVIFDNAATAYTFYEEKNVLNYGNGCTISFHHTKPFGFGEGGAIIVDKKYEREVRCLNNFGIGLTENYWVKEGNNNKMSEISAVYILQYLINNFDTIVKTTHELYDYFKEKIKKNNITEYKLFPSFHSDIIVPSCISILFEKDGINDIVIDKLIKNNISARKYYHPLDNSKNANLIYSRIVCIPCNCDMNLEDIDNIFNLLLNE